MEPAKVVRGLRIAWTAVFGILCVLLVLLWVRSHLGGYEWAGYVLPNRIVFLTTYPGEFVFYSYPPIKGNSDSSCGFTVRHLVYVTLIGGEHIRIQLPSWIAVILSAFVGTVPWLRWRFSLRTLLIATTAIALLLGFIVWSIRS